MSIVKIGWRKKTYRVSGTIKGYWEAPYQWIKSQANIIIPFAQLVVNATPISPWDIICGYSDYCSNPECPSGHTPGPDLCGEMPEEVDCDTGAGRYGSTIAKAGGFMYNVPDGAGGYYYWWVEQAVGITTDWYPAWPPCTFPDMDNPHFVGNGDIGVEFSVETEFETDLRFELLAPHISTNPNCSCHAEGCAPPGHLYCGRDSDASAVWLQDHSIRMYETIRKAGTNENGDYGIVTVRANVGGHTVEFERQVSCDIDVTDYNEMMASCSVEPGGYGESSFPITSEKLTHDMNFSRIFTDGVSTHTWNASYTGPIPNTGQTGQDGSATFVLSGNNLKAYYKCPSYGTIKHYQFVFRDIAGAWQVNYGGPVADCTVDGTFSPRNVRIRSDVEAHPILKPADGSHPTPWWCWDVAQGATPVEFTGNDGHTETWGGKWDFAAYPTVVENGPYYIGIDSQDLFGHCVFVDTPQDADEAMHGYLHVDECKDYNEPWMDYNSDGFLSRGHVSQLQGEEWVDVGHEQDDGRVLLKIGIAADVTHYKAATLGVGMVAGGEMTILDFNSLTGWTKSNDISLGLDEFGLLISGFTEGETAWIQKDYTSLNKRMTGTRFLKVRWWSEEAGTQVRMTINNQSWVLSASGQGSQTSIIDMALPEQIHQQAQSVIPIERPQDYILPKTQPQPSHAVNLGNGWGIGRIGVVRFDFLTPGSAYRVEDIKLFRRTTLDGGRMEMWLAPQAPYNNSRASVPDGGVGGAVNGAGDAGVMFAGEHKVYDEVYHTYTSWEDYYQIAGIVHVDGCVIAEIAIGGQQWYKKEGCEGWTWEWFTNSANFFPAFPLDDYTKMGSTTDFPEYEANGILTITPEDPPNWGVLPGGGLDCKLPANLVAYLDPYFGPVTGGQELWATVRVDSVQHHVGFGAVVGGIEKYFRGLVWGIAFTGTGTTGGRYAKEGTPIHYIVEEGTGDEQHLQTSVGKLGIFYFDNTQSRLAGASAEVNDNHEHAVTVYPRNRCFTRVLLADVYSIHGPTYHPSLRKPTYVPALNRPEYI